MTELTSKERVMRLLNKEPIDTMPFFSGMGMVVMPGIEKAGFNFSTVHTSAERMAWSAIHSARLMNAARLKAEHALSFADCFAVATAKRENVIVMTGDPKFKNIEHMVKIEWL